MFKSIITISVLPLLKKITPQAVKSTFNPQRPYRKFSFLNQSKKEENLYDALLRCDWKERNDKIKLVSKWLEGNKNIKKAIPDWQTFIDILVHLKKNEDIYTKKIEDTIFMGGIVGYTEKTYIKPTKNEIHDIATVNISCFFNAIQYKSMDELINSRERLEFVLNLIGDLNDCPYVFLKKINPCHLGHLVENENNANEILDKIIKKSSEIGKEIYYNKYSYKHLFEDALKELYKEYYYSHTLKK